jgi:ABC-type Mn2+/Zn2+ transport system permease subunit
MLGCLVTAVLLTVLAESRAFRHSKRIDAILPWAALLSCYGVCVGLVSALLAYFFHISEWLTLAIAVPLACPLFVLAAKAGES